MVSAEKKLSGRPETEPVCGFNVKWFSRFGSRSRRSIVLSVELNKPGANATWNATQHVAPTTTAPRAESWLVI